MTLDSYELRLKPLFWEKSKQTIPQRVLKGREAGGSGAKTAKPFQFPCDLLFHFIVYRRKTMLC